MNRNEILWHDSNPFFKVWRKRKLNPFFNVTSRQIAKMEREMEFRFTRPKKNKKEKRNFECHFLISLQTADVSPHSSPLRNVSRRRKSATQRQQFHDDDVNQCLHNKSGDHGVANANLFNFTFLLVDFGKVLCSSANELQQNSNVTSREDYIIFHKY